MNVLILSLFGLAIVGGIANGESNKRCRVRSYVSSSSFPVSTSTTYFAAQTSTFSSSSTSSTVLATSNTVIPQPITTNPPHQSTNQPTANQKGALDVHNSARAAHGVSALSWSSSLEA